MPATAHSIDLSFQPQAQRGGGTCFLPNPYRTTGPSLTPGPRYPRLWRDGVEGFSAGPTNQRSAHKDVILSEVRRSQTQSKDPMSLKVTTEHQDISIPTLAFAALPPNKKRRTTTTIEPGCIAGLARAKGPPIVSHLLAEIPRPSTFGVERSVARTPPSDYLFVSFAQS